MDWEKSGSAWQQFAALTVKNTGNAPTYLTAVEWRNSPQAKVSASETVTTNLNRLLSPGDDHPSTTTPVYQTEDPTGVYGAIECSELETDTLTVTGTLKLERIRPSYSQTIEYGGEKYACDLTIIDGGPTDSAQTASNGSDS